MDHVVKVVYILKIYIYIKILGYWFWGVTLTSHFLLVFLAQLKTTEKYRNTFMITPSQFSLYTTAFAAKACHKILLYTLDVVAELILRGIESGVNV